MTSLEFRIPISPVRSMYSNVRLAALSLARLGPPYATARILVSVGDCASHEQVVADTPWACDFPIEWRVASHRAFETDPYPASGNDRFSENPRADVIVLCDADTCVIRPFDDLLATLAVARPRAAGLQAHYSPFFDRRPAVNDATWTRLLDFAGSPRHPLDYGYSMVPDSSQGRAPAYFNYGVVAFNRSGFHRVAPIVTKYTDLANRFLTEQRAGHPGYQSQIGLTLSFAAAEIETLPLGHAFNCANDDLVFANGLADLDDVRVIHYLRTDEFDRDRFVSEPEAHRRFVADPLQNRISERLRQHVLRLPDPLLTAPGLLNVRSSFPYLQPPVVAKDAPA